MFEAAQMHIRPNGGKSICCDPSRRLQGVVIVDSEHMIEAGMRAGLGGADQGAQFCEGHELDPRECGADPAGRSVGRMLDHDQAAKLIRRIGRGIPPHRCGGVPLPVAARLAV
jgi:hypothetical protein